MHFCEYNVYIIMKFYIPDNQEDMIFILHAPDFYIVNLSRMFTIIFIEFLTKQFSFDSSVQKQYIDVSCNDFECDSENIKHTKFRDEDVHSEILLNFKDAFLRNGFHQRVNRNVKQGLYNLLPNILYLDRYICMTLSNSKEFYMQ